MTYSFNLIDEPWIPCILPNGDAQELSLRETLTRAHELRAIFDQSPLATAALHRLLLAILHRNFGPASRAEWKKLWQRGRFDEDTLNAYFSQWKHRFDLFDEKYPFYQVAQFKTKQKEVEMNDILPELSRGNNPTLFDHTTNETSPRLSPTEAARTLLVIQSYKQGGRSGLEENYVDAPATRSVYFIVLGTTLFETLLLNLVRYQGDDPLPLIGDDCPVWEQNELRTSSLPQGYLDYLTWQTLSLRLIPQLSQLGEIGIEKVQLALGRKFERGRIFDPGCAYYKNAKAKTKDDPWLFLRFFEHKMLWRDSTTLLRLAGQETRPPLTLTWVAQLVNDEILDAGAQYRLAAYGICPDKASIIFWRQEQLPLPVCYLADENLVETLSIALSRAEATGSALQRAMNLLSKRLLYPNKQETNLAKAQSDEAGRMTLHLAAKERYWVSLEIPFLHLTRTLPGNPDVALTEWMQVLRFSALNAFDETTGSLDQSARVLRAVVTSRGALTSRLYHILESEQ